MSSGVGSLVFALFCAARKISLSCAIASSSAAMLFSRPTNSCDTMCGNTMISRSGNAGTVRRGAALRSLGSFLKNMNLPRVAGGLARFGRRARCRTLPAIAYVTRSADAGFLVINDERGIPVRDRVLVDDDFLDALLGRHLVHDVEHRLFQDGAQTAGAALTNQRLLSDGLQSALGELQLHAVHLEQLLKLLHQAVLGLGQDVDQRVFRELVQGGDHRQTADELRNQAELQ